MFEPTGPGERPGGAESPSRTAGNGPTGSVGPREPFDWLDDAQLRHGGLRMIRTAIARGWLEGAEHADRRARLVDALAKLALDPASPTRRLAPGLPVARRLDDRRQPPDARPLATATPEASPP